MDYGRETIPLLDTQAARYGFTVQHLAVQPPGLDQKATWLRVKVAQPDWVILRTFGVMTPTALKEAAQVGIPRDKIVGAAPTCTEQDMVPAGEAAIGFICATWYGTGRTSRSSRRSCHTSMPGAGAGARRGCRHGPLDPGCCEACSPRRRIRTAMRHFGHQPLTGAQVQWGSNTSPHRRVAQGAGGGGPIPPLTLSCRDHEGGGGVKFQQWDGSSGPCSPTGSPDQALVRPLVEASAAKYAQEKGITPRACP